MFIAYIDPGSGYTVFGLSTWLIALLLSLSGVLSFFIKRIWNFFKKRKKIVFSVFGVIACIVFIVIGVVMKSNQSKFDKRIIILGFDALSPKIMEPMMESGALPNFSLLKEEGSYSHLATTNPPQSPVAWAGFATGQNPGKSGMFSFIKRNPKNYSLSIAITNIKGTKAAPVLKTKKFWDYTSGKRVPTVIIACPVTFPPDKIYGRMLSGMGVPDILGTQGTFSFYTTEPVTKSKDIGGNVFQVEKTNPMKIRLIGPKKGAHGKEFGENIKVPCSVTLTKDKESVIIEYQKTKFNLKKRQWSDWKEVEFKLDALRTMKGILRFYLIEASPAFKLYVSPINFDPRKPFFRISHPDSYGDELARNIGLFYTQGMPLDTWAMNENRLSEEPFLKQATEVLREKKAMLDFELNRLNKGVLFCYFESPDIIQHMFWRYTDEKHPLYEKDAPQKYKNAIMSWYQKMDNILGGVLEKLGEEDVLIVLSDHGFGTFRRAVHINSWLRKNGYLRLRNTNAQSGAELLSDIDWSKTKAYAVGFGAIYINQEGRERDGIAAPGEETSLLKQQIAEQLKKWVDEKYNEPIVSRVYQRDEIFWGDYVSEAPDLYVGFNIGYRASWQTALGAVPAVLIEDNLKKWSGSHLFDPKLIPGVLFSNRKITKANPSIYDIAPTVLKLSGFTKEKIKECNFDGTPLF